MTRPPTPLSPGTPPGSDKDKPIETGKDAAETRRDAQDSDGKSLPDQGGRAPKPVQPGIMN